MASSWALTYYGLLLALTATGHFVDDVSFMMLRDQRAHRSRQAVNDYEHATVTETDLHPVDVASWSSSPGAVIAIGTRVPDCRSDYFPSIDPDSNDGTLRLVDRRSGSWARLHYDHDNGPAPGAPVRPSTVMGCGASRPPVVGGTRQARRRPLTVHPHPRTDNGSTGPSDTNRRCLGSSDLDV